MGAPNTTPNLSFAKRGQRIYGGTSGGVKIAQLNSGQPNWVADADQLAASGALYDALKWFIDDIDSTHTAMLDFDANVERARNALALARGEKL